MAALVYLETARKRNWQKSALHSEVIRPGKGVVARDTLHSRTDNQSLVRLKLKELARILCLTSVQDGAIRPGMSVTVLTSDAGVYETYNAYKTELQTGIKSIIRNRDLCEIIYRAETERGYLLQFDGVGMLTSAMRQAAYEYLNAEMDKEIGGD